VKVKHETCDRASVIAVQGEFVIDELDAFQRLAEQQLDADARDFVIDLTDTSFVDSKALEALLWLQEQADERLGQVRLAGPTDNVRKILEVTRLDKHFDSHDDVEAALKSLR
jgi:anti-anti-sigma factor